MIKCAWQYGDTLLTELAYENIGFWGQGKIGVPRGKPLGARTRTNNKLNSHMMPSPGIEPRPHWWETSGLSIAPSLLPQSSIRWGCPDTELCQTPHPIYYSCSPKCMERYHLIESIITDWVLRFVVLQTGAWGCFDEFNRINIEVLSVVAQQILSILSALSAGATRFVFEGREINLVWSCGIFITMNPGTILSISAYTRPCQYNWIWHQGPVAQSPIKLIFG